MTAGGKEANIDHSGQSRRLSIEEQGRIWAERSIERMRRGEGRVVLLVKAIDKDKLKLPALTARKGFGRIRYDELGNIYTPRWRSMDTEWLEDGRRVLVNPQNDEYRVLRPRPRQDYLNNLPRDPNIPVFRIEFPEIDSDIRTAIRYQRNVLNRFRGESEDSEVAQARDVIEYADSLANRFIIGGLTKADLDVLAATTLRYLEDKKLVEPRDPNKKKMREMLLRTPLTVHGKIIPMVSRVRARATYLAGVKRLLVGAFVAEKYGAYLFELEYEEETTRWSLNATVRQLQQFTGHVAFTEPYRRETERQREIMAMVLRTIAENYLGLARVKPYLVPAREAAIGLVGCRKEKEELNTRILGEDKASYLFGRPSVADLIKQGRFYDAHVQIIVNQAILMGVLKKYEPIGESEEVT